jgi:hypothetical protein
VNNKKYIYKKKRKKKEKEKKKEVTRGVELIELRDESK